MHTSKDSFFILERYVQLYTCTCITITVLLLFQPQGELQLEDTSGAITVCHCLAMGAFDYNKKNSVLRVTTSDWHSFLLQAK